MVKKPPFEGGPEFSSHVNATDNNASLRVEGKPVLFFMASIAKRAVKRQYRKVSSQKNKTRNQQS